MATEEEISMGNNVEKVEVLKGKKKIKQQLKDN